MRKRIDEEARGRLGEVRESGGKRGYFGQRAA
jgi:hypothetical protein